MVEIRVAVGDAGSAHGLLRRLVTLFGRSAISFDQKRKEVTVRSEWESRSVVEVIDAVQAWLAADGVGSAKLSIGGQSYTLFGENGRLAVDAGEQADVARIEGATAPVLRRTGA